jgi:hypothetical protein
MVSGKWTKKCALNKNILNYGCFAPSSIAEAKYCVRHGCRFCNFVNPKLSFKNPSKKIEVKFGKHKEETCSIECKNTAEQNYSNKNLAEE